MNTLKTSMLLAMGAVSLASLAAVPVQAAGPAAKYAGSAPSSVAGCPSIAWRLAKADDGALRGMVWYDDMSGLSKASGTAENGKFHVTLTFGHGTRTGRHGRRRRRGQDDRAGLRQREFQDAADGGVGRHRLIPGAVDASRSAIRTGGWRCARLTGWELLAPGAAAGQAKRRHAGAKQRQRRGLRH